MTLREQRASDLTSVFFNTDEFGESVTYQPAEGGAIRTLLVVVMRESGVAEQQVLELRDSLLVLVGRDETAECGGIARPTLGDRLWRASDLPEEPYLFTGEIVQEDQGVLWALRFARARPFRVTAKR